MKKLFENKWVQSVTAVTVCILIYKFIDNPKTIKEFLGYLSEVFFPCTLGLVIALFLYKPVSKARRFFEKSKLSFIQKNALPFGIALVFMLVIALIILVVNFIFPPLYRNMQELSKNLPSYYQTLKTFVTDNEYARKFISENSLDSVIKKALNFGSIAKYIGVISGVANSFITCFISIVLSIYILLDKDKIFSVLRLIRHKFFPDEKTTVFINYARKTVNLFYSYFSGLLIDAVFMGTVSAIIYIIFKLPYAFILGLIVAIGNLIPFFGPIISTVIVFFISVVTLGPTPAIGLLILQFVMAQVDANFFQPKILSQSTGVSPLIVLVAVTVFGNFWGVPGMILGVPACAVIKIVILDYLDDGKIDGN